MADAQGVSDTTVYRIWKAHRLQPHRGETLSAVALSASLTAAAATILAAV
jgi:hypothetical protein